MLRPDAESRRDSTQAFGSCSEADEGEEAAKGEAVEGDGVEGEAVEGEVEAEDLFKVNTLSKSLEYLQHFLIRKQKIIFLSMISK